MISLGAFLSKVFKYMTGPYEKYHWHWQTKSKAMCPPLNISLIKNRLQSRYNNDLYLAFLHTPGASIQISNIPTLANPANRCKTFLKIYVNIQTTCEISCNPSSGGLLIRLWTSFVLDAMWQNYLVTQLTHCVGECN